MADEPLLLGLVDENMDENEDTVCGWSTNKIGGTPNWMCGAPNPYPTCCLCNQTLYLVCQIYCPLSESIFHRVLYIFGCVSNSCWNKSGSWKVLRSQTKDSYFDQVCVTRDESPGTMLDVDEWCDDAEDWGDEDKQENAAFSDLGLFTARMKLTESKPSWWSPHESFQKVVMEGNKERNLENSISHFKPFYVSVIQAAKDQGNSGQLTRHVKTLLSKYQQREGILVDDLMSTNEGISGWTGEKYEHSSLKHGNKAFYKFQKKLQTYPQQCLRYQWNGTPVSMVTTNASDLSRNVPPCQHCGAPRVFEVQLMPALVGKLKLVECNSTVSDSDSATTNNESSVHFSSRNPNSPGNCSDMKTVETKFEKQSTLQNGAIPSDRPQGPDEQRKVLTAAVNQSCDIAIEFGTVIVYTCGRSCWKNGPGSTAGAEYLDEYVFVEAEPDGRFFR